MCLETGWVGTYAAGSKEERERWVEAAAAASARLHDPLESASAAAKMAFAATTSCRNSPCESQKCERNNPASPSLDCAYSRTLLQGRSG